MIKPITKIRNNYILLHLIKNISKIFTVGKYKLKYLLLVYL